MTEETLQYLAKLSRKPEFAEIVRRYISTCSRLQELEAVIAEEGFTVVSTKGTTMIHPVMRELRSLQDDLLKMEKELLLTPRSKGDGGEPEKANRLEEFINGGSINN